MLTKPIKLLSICLLCWLVFPARGQSVAPKIFVKNLDPRGYLTKGEKTALRIFLSSTKKSYLIQAKINGQLVYRLNAKKPTNRFYHYIKAKQVGQHKLAIELKYVTQKVLKKASSEYTYEVKAPAKTLFKRFFRDYPNAIPVYRNAQGQVLPVQFKGDTAQVKIYPRAKNIYIIPRKTQKHVLTVYHRGKVIDQIRFQVTQLPAPQIQLLNASDSTSLQRNGTSTVLVSLKETPTTLFLLDSIPRKFSVESIEVTHQHKHKDCIIGDGSVRIQNNIYKLRFPSTIRNGKPIICRQKRDLILVKALEVYQIISPKNRPVPSLNGRKATFRVALPQLKIPLSNPVPFQYFIE